MVEFVDEYVVGFVVGQLSHFAGFILVILHLTLFVFEPALQILYSFGELYLVDVYTILLVFELQLSQLAANIDVFYRHLLVLRLQILQLRLVL